jgi:hypothetical protein
MDTLRGYGQSLAGYSQGALNFLNSNGLIPQIILTILIILLIHVIILMIENVVQGIKNYSRLAVTILPDTYDEAQNYLQTRDSKNSLMYPSNNELNGLEFSYSFHLYVDPKTFDSATSSSGFYNVFWKGSASKPWPLLNPGVFVGNDAGKEKNNLRIYQNSVTNHAEYVDIPNIPIGKYMHIVITQRGANMDVYINGNVIKRHVFTTVPKINYGGVYVFSPTTLNQANAPVVLGSVKGYISRLKYFAYAISYPEIDSLMREGPSAKIVKKTSDQTPPYFHDSWWVTRYM